MSGLIDGVSKGFLVFHSRGSMHVEGCKTFIDLAEQAMIQHWAESGYKNDSMQEVIDHLAARLQHEREEAFREMNASEL